MQSLDHLWREAVVCSVSQENRTALLHFRFWSKACDATLPWDSPRCAPHGTHVYSVHSHQGPSVGHNVDYRADPFTPWYSGQVIDIREEGAGGEEEEGMGSSSNSSSLGAAPTQRRYLIRPHPLQRGLPSQADCWVPQDSLQPFEWRTRAVVPYVASKATFWEKRKRQPTVQHTATAAPMQALLGGLRSAGLLLLPMGGDGNCLFRSVADQVYGDQEQQGVCRAAAAAYMASESAFFRNYVADDEGGWEAYLANIARDGVWGDDPELQALCEIYGRPAEVWSTDSLGQLRRLRVFNSSSGEGEGGQGAAAAAPAATAEAEMAGSSSSSSSSAGRPAAGGAPAAAAAAPPPPPHPRLFLGRWAL